MSGITLSLSAAKGSKCLCGKRANATVYEGQRALVPCCMKCGLVAMQVGQLRSASEAAGPKRDDDSFIGPLREWLITSSGTSSQTIVSVLVPELRELALGRLGWGGAGSPPWDPDDFGRCYRCLKLIPGGVERLGEVAAKYPAWAGLVKEWPLLTALYEEEEPSGRAPKLYRKMKRCLGERE